MPSRRRSPRPTRPVAGLGLGLLSVALVLSGCGAGVAAPGSTGAAPGSTGAAPGSTGAAPGGGAVSGGAAPPASGATERTVPWTTATGVPQPLPEPPDAPGIPVPTVTDPEPGQRERRIGWRFVSGTATPGPGLVVEATAGGTPCDTVTGVEVVETATSVTVTVWAGRTPAAGTCDGPQVAMARIYRLRVPLAAPLGSRAVLPGPVG